jgi:uncharacterized protein YegP (UPF0339 family)
MKIEIRAATQDGYWWWVLKARNGRILATSEIYDSPGNAKRAARKTAKMLKLPVTGPMMGTKT